MCSDGTVPSGIFLFRSMHSSFSSSSVFLIFCSSLVAGSRGCDFFLARILEKYRVLAYRWELFCKEKVSGISLKSSFDTLKHY